MFFLERSQSSWFIQHVPWSDRLPWRLRGSNTNAEKRKHTLDDDMPPLNVSLSLSLSYTIAAGNTPTVHLFSAFCEFRTVILVLRHVPSPQSCSSSCHRMPQSMLTSAGQTNNDSQSHWQSDLLRLRQDAVLSRGISLLQLITQLMFVAVSDFIYFNPLPVQTVLS